MTPVFELDAKRIPASPGVYLFEDASGEVLYVGKAASLRSRVRSYFGSPKGKPDMVRAMMERAAAVRVMVTDNEMEALALECNLIKRHKPRYNIMLRDDKHYPYIIVTLKDRWPRVLLARKARKDGSRYFGPYYPAGTVHETLGLCRRLYPFRTCSDRQLSTASRPCLNYHIGRCLAPCQGNVSEDEYRSMISEMCLFLEGKRGEVKERLKQRMDERSMAMDFEAAARLRDQIQALERLGVEQKVISTSNRDHDVVGFARDDDLAVVMVMFIREGRLLGQKPYTMRGVGGASLQSLLGIFLGQHYAECDVPPGILLPVEAEGSATLEGWLERLRGSRVRLSVPRRGEKRRLVEMASRNAQHVMEGVRLESSPSNDVAELAEVLGLDNAPRRVECFDISNLQGKQPVGSMVVFVEGEPRKDLYRTFKVRTGDSPDDYRMMREVLERRLKRGLAGDPAGWKLPDLLVVDGGQGHLGVALDVARELGIDVPVLALAKEEETVYCPETGPLQLPRSSGALRFLMRVRDEAHRTAIGHHRRMRGGQTRRSALDEIPGVGAARKRALLKAFGSTKGVAEAGIDDIASVRGIGPRLARCIKEHLNR